MEFHFRPGASLHLQRFTVSHQVDQLVWSGTVAGLFVNGTDVTSWCCPLRASCPVTRRFSAAVKVCFFAGVTLRICHPRSVLSPSTFGGAGAHLSALQGIETKLTASICCCFSTRRLLANSSQE